MKGIVYLAIPYSHPDKQVRHRRFEIVNKVAADLMRQGEIVFSPISHSHVIAVENDLPTDWDYWKKSCMEFVTRSDKVVVVCVDGWKESTGVQAEIKIAKQNNIPIEYINV